MKQIQGGVTAPKGFRAAGIHCGVKQGKCDGNQPIVSSMKDYLTGKKDLAMILSEQECNAAAVYTLNRVKAAPLYVTMEHLEDGVCRGVIANSGNANACAPYSHENAQRMCQAAAAATGLKESDFVVASTGVIGQTLNIAAIEKGMPVLVEQLSDQGSDDAANAIMTTDTEKKEIALSLTIGGKTVTIGAIAKGSGMIHPNMGTMLAFITTDCAITSEMLSDAMREIVPRTFNRVTVDGDTSTNDMCVVLANGMAGNEVRAPGPVHRRRRRGGQPPGDLHRVRRPQRGERRAPCQGGGGLRPGEGRHVRRRRQLGPGAVRHGVLQGPLPPGVCGHLLPLHSGGGGRVPPGCRPGL